MTSRMHPIHKWTLASLAFVALMTPLGLAISAESVGAPDEEALLALPFKQFDQTLGSGWRVYADRNEHLKAAELIRTYLSRRYDLTPAQRAASNFHAAAELARANRTDEALQHLEKAQVDPGVTGVPEDWNELVISTTAFLLGDRVALLESKRRVEAMRDPKFPGSAERLLKYLGQPYGTWDKEPSR